MKRVNLNVVDFKSSDWRVGQKVSLTSIHGDKIIVTLLSVEGGMSQTTYKVVDCELYGNISGFSGGYIESLN